MRRKKIFRIFCAKNLQGTKRCSNFALANEKYSRMQTLINGAVVQLVRIHACHAWGREFESRPHRSGERKSGQYSLRIICPLFLCNFLIPQKSADPEYIF